MASTPPIQTAQRPAQPTAQLPAQIEIFRAGRHIDDAGTVHNFSAADVAGMVRSYDTALREAPLTIGHPADNLPAYGWVKGLGINAAGNLVMDTHQVQPQFAEMLSAKLFKKRSASFYTPSNPHNPKPGNWYLRHVAFLGAQPPAISGLADFASDSADGAVSFSEGTDSTPPETLPATLPTTLPATLPADPSFNQEHIRMSQELKDQLAVAQAQLAQANADRAAIEAAKQQAEAEATAARGELAAFAESARTARTVAFTSFAEGLVKTGGLLPKEKDAAVALLTAAHDAKPVSFSEGGAVKTVTSVDFLKDLMTRAKPAVNFGEHAAASMAGSPGTGTQGMSDDEINTKTLAYARQHKVSYAEALSQVASFTS
jgi:hypothetical protein